MLWRQRFENARSVSKALELSPRCSRGIKFFSTEVQTTKWGVRILNRRRHCLEDAAGLHMRYLRCQPETDTQRTCRLSWWEGAERISIFARKSLKIIRRTCESPGIDVPDALTNALDNGIAQETQFMIVFQRRKAWHREGVVVRESFGVSFGVRHPG